MNGFFCPIQTVPAAIPLCRIPFFSIETRTGGEEKVFEIWNDTPFSVAVISTMASPSGVHSADSMALSIKIPSMRIKGSVGV